MGQGQLCSDISFVKSVNSSFIQPLFQSCFVQTVCWQLWPSKGEKSPISDTQELNFYSGNCSSIEIECAFAIRSIVSLSGQGIRVVSCKRQHLDLTVEELYLIRGIWMRRIFEADQRNCPNIEG